MPNQRSPAERRPRQARAIATRRRVYEAAIAEFERVGVEQARVEDIVAAAGVSWGTFFHYFPRKEDVVLEAATSACRALAAACADGLEHGRPVGSIVANAFYALRESAPRPGPVRNAVMRNITNNPVQLIDYLGDDIPHPVKALAEVIEAGQRRGELRDDQPAESFAAVLVHAVIASGQREAALGRVAGVEGRPTLPLTVLAVELILRGMRPDSPREIHLTVETGGAPAVSDPL